MNLSELASVITAPMHALPIDVFRVGAGSVGLWYFARTLAEVRDFSSPEGLIDHELARHIFPPTRMSLFRPGVSRVAFQGVFLAACLASLLVIVGYQVKAAALFLFLVAVSTYRWNILVIYVDDAIMHLVFLWLILLPLGHTLTLEGWLRGGPAAFDAWISVTVPGASTRFFLFNLAWVYFVAGAYKWTSPMWREGSALHAILKLPICYSADYWKAGHVGVLRLLTHGGLAIEPLFALLLFLPASSPSKWLLLAAVVVFHIGILATLKIPFANAAMLGALPIFMSQEIMQLGFGQLPPGRLETIAAFGIADAAALALVTSLVGMILWEVRALRRFSKPPLWKTHNEGFRSNPFYVGLWVVGIAQSYRLFDWIDVRNHHVSYRIVGEGAGGKKRRVDPDDMFPRTLRHLLLQSYVHGNVWLQIDPAALRRLRRSLIARYAHRYARRHPEAATVEVLAVTQRVTSDNLDLTRGVERLLVRFTCRGGEAVIDPSSLPDGVRPEEPALPRVRSAAGANL